jgi:hypothetical protein
MYKSIESSLYAGYECIYDVACTRHGHDPSISLMR